MDPFGGLAVQDGGLGWPDGLPGGDGVPDDRVDRFGERGAGLVHRDVQQADRILAERFVVGVAGDGDILALPAYAPHPQPDDLVAAQPAEQPGQCQRPQQFDGVFAADRVGVDVAVLEVEAGP